MPAPRRVLLPLALFIACVALFFPGLIATARYSTDPLRYVLDQVQARGKYRYDARIQSVITPQPTLENAGLSPQTQDLAVRGSIDLRAEQLDLQILNDNGNFDAGSGVVHIRVADGIAEGRVGASAWQPIELTGDAFGPTGDMLPLLSAARDVGPAERVHLGGYELTRYTFTIDGRRFAQHMRDQLERSMRDQNMLPVGTSVGLIDAYLRAEGSGEIFVDASGLPVRQVVHLTIPDDRRDQTVSGTITVDFTGFAPAPALARPFQWVLAVDWSALLANLFLLAVAFAGMGLLLALRRTRRVQAGVAIGMTLILLATPLLHPGRAAAAETAALAAAPAAAVSDSSAETRTALRSAGFNLAQQLSAGTDTDGDGLTDTLEADLFPTGVDHNRDGMITAADNDLDGDGFTNGAADRDSDGDTLSDGVEALEVGTSLLNPDTDGDSLNDALELQPFFGPDGRTWRFDPFNPDTNRDGMNDFLDCLGDDFCPDQDGDNIPNAWDNDNDGDGVPDQIDSAPVSAISGGPGPNGALLGVTGGAFTLTLSGNQANLPMLVDLTIRPTNPGRLWYSGNVLDWPSNDRDGQIKRVFDTTLGAEGDLADGDMRLVPMLEITIPYSAGTFGGLPVKASYSGSDFPSLAGIDLGNSTAIAAWFNEWLDQDLLKSYETTVRIKAVNAGMPDLLVYAPLSVLRDPIGDMPVAFTSRLFYRPKTDLTDHTIRLAWSVQMQTDVCSSPPAADAAAGETFNWRWWRENQAPEDQRSRLLALPDNLDPEILEIIQDKAGYTKWKDLSSSERSSRWCGGTQHWTTNTQPTIVHTYYDDFYVAALDVVEEGREKVALIAQDANAGGAPLFQHHLWSLLDRLDRTFVPGRDCDTIVAGACAGDDLRDITVETIKARFDRAVNAGTTTTERWGIPQDALHVATYSFPSRSDMAQLFFTQQINGVEQEPLLNTWLNNLYAPARGSSAALATPTVLVARETTSRKADLTAGMLISGTTALVDLGRVHESTLASINWRAFQYAGAGIWQSYEVAAYQAATLAAYEQVLSGFGGPVAADADTLAGGVELLQRFYLAGTVGHATIASVYDQAAGSNTPASHDSNLAVPQTPTAVAGMIAESMAGLVLDAENQLLVEADTAGLLAALGRHTRGADGGSAMSLFQNLGHVGSSDRISAMVAGATAGISFTVSEIKPGVERVVAGIELGIGTATTVKDTVETLQLMFTKYAAKRAELAANLADAKRAMEMADDIADQIDAATSSGAASSAIKNLLNQADEAMKVQRIADSAVDATKRSIKQLNKFEVGPLDIIVEVVVAAAKLFALIESGKANVITVGKWVVETIVSALVNIYILGQIAAIVPIGTIVAVILAVIDGIIAAICFFAESDSFICDGIVGNVVKVITAIFWDANPLVDMEFEGRMNPTNWQMTPRDPVTGLNTGLVSNNNLDVRVDVVTTLDVNNYTVIRSGSQYDSTDLISSTFRYEFTTTEEKDPNRIHERRALSLRQMLNDWKHIPIDWGFDRQVYTQTVTTTLLFDRPTINWKPDGFYLAEGYAVPGVLCITAACTNYTVDESNYFGLADQFVFDVFPNTLDGFYSLSDSDGNKGFRLSWDSRFPDLADADGDDLRSIPAGGNDPNDSSPDSDSDGLSDLFELQKADIGLDPNRADTDSDGVSDYDEVRLGLDPAVADIDNDGLNDGAELAGWDIVYGYAADGAPLRFRTGSDPFIADTDGDGILDNRERIYGFNPRVVNSGDPLSIQSQLFEGDGIADRVISAGSSVAFNTTILNNLRDRFALGLFEADLATTGGPPDLAPASYRLGPGEQATRDGSLSLVQQVDSIRTTALVRAGAIIADLAQISGGRVLWLPFEESSLASSFADVAPFNHTATCAGFFTCPFVTNNGYSGRALNFFSGSVLNIAHKPTLSPERFTLSFWLRPIQSANAQTVVRQSVSGNTRVRFALTIPPNTTKLNVFAHKSTNCTDTAVASDSTNALSADSWSLVTLVHDGNRLRLFVNGRSEGDWASGALCNEAAPISLGGMAGSTLDDLSLYPFPMTVSEVQAQFRDPVLRLAFNGGTTDSSNLRQQVTNAGAGAPSLANSRNGDRVGVFDKKRWLNVQPGSSLNMSEGTGQFSLSAFIRPVPLGPDSGWQGVFGLENGFNTYPSLYLNENGQLRVTFGNGSALCDSGATPNVLANGAWNHVTVSYDGNQFIFYVNGVQAAQLPRPGACAADSRPRGNSLYIGRVSPDATFTVSKIEVTDEGDGSGNAEYRMFWEGAQVWSQDDIVGATPPNSYVPSPSSFSMTADRSYGFRLLEDDDVYDDINVDQTVQPHQVTDSGRWNYDDDGRGTVLYQIWNNWFNGDLDEVQIFRVALNAADARDLYNRLNNRAYALQTRLEEPPTVTLFRDGSGNLLTGYCDGASCPTSGLPGRDGQAAHFDGNDSIVISDRPKLDLAAGLTVSAWVRLDNPSDDQKIISKFDPNFGGYTLGVSNGRIYAEVRDTAGVRTELLAGTVPAGVWTHLAMTAGAGTALIGYINGVEVGRSSLPQTNRRTVAYAAPTTGSATIYGDRYYANNSDGMIWWLNGDVNSFDPSGLADDDNEASSVRFFSQSCLTLFDDKDWISSERVVCDDTPVLKGFENLAESARFHTTPPNYNAAEQALVLNRDQRQHLRIEPGVVSNPVFSTISIAAWVKPTNRFDPVRQTIVARGSDGMPEGFSFRVNNDGRLSFQAGNGSWTSNSALGSGWQHVAVTLDGTRVRFYLNGVESGNFGFGGNINDMLGPILIGRMPQCGAAAGCDFFNGALRDVVVYTRAISGDEVLGLRGVNQGLTAGNPEASAADPNGRVFFLPLDENVGNREFRTLVVDSFGVNDQPLTIGRASWDLNHFVTGMIDEVAVLEYASTPAQVTDLMGSAPVLRMAFDEFFNATTFSDVASATPGTCDACPLSGARGRIREALVFAADGNADRIRIADENRLDLSRFSVEFWLRPDVVRSSEQIILAKGDNYRLSLVPNSLRLRLQTNTGSVMSNRALNLGQWNHIIATYDGSNLRLFINGSVEPAAAAAAPALNSEPLLIGNNAAGDLPFSGMIDELAIYGYAFSTEEVTAHYQYQESWFDTVDRFDLTVDGDAPEARLSLADNTVIADAPLQVVVLAEDPTSRVVSVFYDNDGDSLADNWQPATPGADGNGWFFVFTPPGSGSFPLRAYAVDAVGRQSAVALTNVRIDVAPPTLSVPADLGAAVLGPARGVAADAGVWLLPLSGTADDALSAPVTVAARIIGPEGVVGNELVVSPLNGVWSGDYRFPTPPNGTYLLEVQATDALGNRTAPLTRTLDLDATAPTADVTLGHTSFATGPTQGGPLPRPAAQTGPRPWLTGTIDDAPALADRLLIAHFEEPAGADQFLDGSAFQGRGGCQVPACPIAGDAGYSGAALSFDGIDDAVTFAGLLSGSDPRASVAMSLWLRPNGVGLQNVLRAGTSDQAQLAIRLDGTTVGIYMPGTAATPLLSGSVNAAEWNSLIVSVSGERLVLYLNGAPVDSAAAPADLDSRFAWLELGAADAFAGSYSGGIDELAVYAGTIGDQAARLLHDPIKSDVANLKVRFTHLRDRNDPAAALQRTATLTPTFSGMTLWGVQVPAGIEGPYLVDLESTDSLGNQRRQVMAWAGEIDTLAPRVTLLYRDLGDGTAMVGCVIADYNLNPATITCPVPADQWSFVAENADWYREVYSSTVRMVQMVTPIVRLDAPTNTVEACDSFGNCTNAGPTIDPQGFAGVSLITAPADGQIYTSYDPITVRGYARAENGLQTLDVRAGATTLSPAPFSAGMTESLWDATFTPTVDGRYQLAVTAEDTEGTVYSAANAPMILVDTLAPELAVTDLALAGPDRDAGRIAWSGLVSEVVGLTALQVRLDSGVWSDLTLPAAGLSRVISSELELGRVGPFDGDVVTLAVRATDLAGRTTTVSRTLILDTTAPQVRLSAAALQGPDRDLGNLIVGGSITETVGVSLLRARVDGGTWQSLTVPSAGAGIDFSGVIGSGLSGPFDGMNVTIEVEATDADNNIGSDQITITLDTTAPSVSITTLALQGPDRNAGDLAFSGSLSETVAVSLLRVRVNGGTWQTLTTPAGGSNVTFSGVISSGLTGPFNGETVVVAVEVTDSDGNIGVAERSLVLDTTAPTLRIDSLALQGPDRDAGNLQIAGRISETIGLTLLRARVNGGVWQNLTLPSAGTAIDFSGVIGSGLSGPFDGVDVTVEIAATDTSGNIGTAQASITLDTTAPRVSITTLALQGPDRDAGNLSLSGKVTETVGLTLLRARVNGGAWQNLTLPSAGAAMDFSGLIGSGLTGPFDGVDVTVEIAATDSDGNIGTTQRTITLDTVAPVLSISALALAGPDRDAGNLQLAGQISETGGVSLLRARVNGGAWQNLTLPSAGTGIDFSGVIGSGLTGPFDGVDVTVEVEATDNDGNVGLVTQIVTLDTAAPVLSISTLVLQGPDRDAGRLDLNGLISETIGLSSLQVQIDGGPWLDLALPEAGTAVPFSTVLDSGLSGPFDGTVVTVRLRATDSDGNVGVAERSLTLDTTAPLLDIAGLSLGGPDPNAGNLRVLGTISETVGYSLLRAQVNGGAWQNLTLPGAGAGIVLDEIVQVGIAGPYDGLSVTVLLEATDMDGNTGAAEASLILDTVAPLAQIDSLTLIGPDRNAGKLAFAAQLSDSGSLTLVELQINNGMWETVGPELIGSDGILALTLDSGLSGPFDGEIVTVRLRATDGDGNVSTVERSLVLDTTAPKPVITNLALQGPNRDAGKLMLTAEVTETVAITQLRARVNGGAWQSLNLPAAGAGVVVEELISAGVVGPYDGLELRVELEATDADGNTGMAEAQVTLDTIAPSITAVIDDLRYGAPLQLSGSVNDTSGIASVVVTVRGPTGREWQAPLELDPAAINGVRQWRLIGGEPINVPGRYSILVRAEDRAGNAGTLSLDGSVAAPIYRLYLPFIQRPPLDTMVLPPKR